MFFRRSLLLAIILVLTGCSTGRNIADGGRKFLDFDTLVELQISADESLNLDHDGRPSPLVIRVFKLADARQFQREDFLSLYQQAESRLGNDYMGSVRLKELAPGEARLESIPLSEDVNFLGIMAEYSRYDQTRNMLVLPIRAHSRNSFEILASSDGLLQDQ